MSTLNSIGSDVIFQHANPVIHEGFAVSPSFASFAGAYIVQGSDTPQNGVVLRKQNTLAAFGFNGKIELSGNVLLHTLQNPLVASDYEGLFFEDANENTVACVDVNGDLHTVKPVLVNPNLDTEPGGENEFEFITRAPLIYSGNNRYAIRGSDASLPVMQILDSNGNCKIKIQQDGVIVVTGGVFSKVFDTVGYNRIYGSYSFERQ